MKTSLKVINSQLGFLAEIDELIKLVNSRLGSIETFENLADNYQGILLVKIVSCEKHHNADRLHVCKIDDGGKAKAVKRDKDGLVQVVCGAPNVAAGQTAVWIPPGSVVPSTLKTDPLTIDAREFREVLSNGMLASAKELDFSEDHSGILVIEDEVKPGSLVTEVFELDDWIIDLENKMFTHRPDCFGDLGIAREIAGIYHKKFKSPDWYKAEVEPLKGDDSLYMTVNNQLEDVVPRFSAIALRDVEVKPSDLEMQNYLRKVGIKSINNVVDVTNFVMHLTGQPLHAYDYDKVRALNMSEPVELTVRYPLPDEKLKLLNGKTITPHQEAIIIGAQNKAIGLGGVMGGSETEVDSSTKNIILECANFDMYATRRTAMLHGLFTEAVTRYTKGQSPWQIPAVINFAVGLIQHYTKAVIASDMIDVVSSLKPNKPIKVSPDFVNSRLGVKLSASEMVKLLENVEFEVERAGENSIKVTPPFWRTDIELDEDIVEEIGRLYGYDQLPIELPIRQIKSTGTINSFSFNTRLREVLSAAGANELLTYNFVHGDLIAKSGQDPKTALSLSNALSPDLQYYRLSLMPSLLSKIHPNLKAESHKYSENRFALYEINKAHNILDKDKAKLPIEHRSLGFVYAAEKRSAEKYHQGSAYYEAKHYLEYLLSSLNLNTDLISYSHLPESFDNVYLDQASKPFEPKLSAAVHYNDQLIGFVGCFSREVTKEFKLPEFCAGFELSVDELVKHAQDMNYQPISKYPSVQQDITLKTGENLSYQKVTNALRESIEKLKPEDANFSLSPVDIYRPAKNGSTNFTYRVQVEAIDRTLSNEEINNLLDKAAEALSKKHKVSRV